MKTLPPITHAPTPSPHAQSAARVIGAWPVAMSADNGDAIALAWLEKTARTVQDAISADRAALFASMPRQPDDMNSPEGLAAYAEAVLQWRADCGYPEQYDGPTG